MYIYLIKCLNNSFYKIGVSVNPDKRLNQLQTGNQFELKLISKYKSKYAYKIESALHSMYSYNKELNEWFDLSLEDELNFLKTCKKIEDDVIFLIKNNI